MVPIACTHCGAPALVRASAIKQGHGRFCSTACSGSSRKTEPRPCGHCRLLFSPIRGNLRRGGGKFCSANCYWGHLARNVSPGWTRVPGFPWYEAHPDGALRRIGRSTLRWRCHKNTGYLRATLIDPAGNHQTVCLHQIICRTFHGEPPSERHEVAHSDGIRTNCASANLRWATKQENAADRKIHGTELIGERNHQANSRETHFRSCCLPSRTDCNIQ